MSRSGRTLLCGADGVAKKIRCVRKQVRVHSVHNGTAC